MTMMGGCRCGAVRYTVEGSAEHHAICHCQDCRRSSGAPMVGWIAFKDDALSVEGVTVRHASSPGVTREFCGTCGTGLFYRNPAVLPGLVDVQSATLDAPEDAPPMAEIMVKERLGWLDSIGSLPRFATYPGID